MINFQPLQSITEFRTETFVGDYTACKDGISSTTRRNIEGDEESCSCNVLFIGNVCVESTAVKTSVIYLCASIFRRFT